VELHPQTVEIHQSRLAPVSWLKLVVAVLVVQAGTAMPARLHQQTQPQRLAEMVAEHTLTMQVQIS
jgi:hypothetical protein